MHFIELFCLHCPLSYHHCTVTMNNAILECDLGIQKNEQHHIYGMGHHCGILLVPGALGHQGHRHEQWREGGLVFYMQM